MGNESWTAVPGANGLRDARDNMQRVIPSTQVPSRLLSAARVLEIRRLIAEDGYNTVYVADEIARRLLRSGDL